MSSRSSRSPTRAPRPCGCGSRVLLPDSRSILCPERSGSGRRSRCSPMPGRVRSRTRSISAPCVYVNRIALPSIRRAARFGSGRSVPLPVLPMWQFVARLAARDGDEALGVPTFRVDPTLVIVRPPQNALTNNPSPAFTLTYSAQCNGEPCQFANDYFAAYQLSATLNAQPVGAQFAFHASAAEATFTPVTRLPEGQNSFSAQATDGFGHQSSREAITFTVDTIPPKFLTLAPAEGSVLANPNILIQGTIDDPTATVVLAGMGVNRNGVSFSFPAVLLPGLNTYNLSATDPDV